MKRKCLAVGIILLFVATGIIPATALKVTEKPSLPISNGNILYVGGSGPGNYTKIQDAINDSNNGDTVYVFDDSSPYYENLFVNKSIHLSGENRSTTIIDGRAKGNVVNITADRVTISGFTIQNSSSNGYVGGIMIISDYNTISNNTIIKNPGGGVITKCSMVDIGYNVVLENIITDNGIGVNLDSGYFNNVSYNVISSNGVGIQFDEAFNSTIYGNAIENNSYGIYLTDSGNNIFSRNHISGNKMYGVEIFATTNEKFIQNNFIGNRRQVYFIQPIVTRIYFLWIRHHLPLQRNIWDGNYWERPRVLPYPIPGFVNIWFDFGTGDIPLVDFIQFDLHPAQTPYNIPGMR